jgi:predicted site-specific integrase-resolvase
LTAQPIERTAYSVREVTEGLGVSPATFWKYVKNGQIRTLPFGGRTIVTAPEYRRILAEGVGGKSGRGVGRPRKAVAK